MKVKRLREFVVIRENNGETTRVRTPGPLMETAKMKTLVLLKQTARESTNLQRTNGKVASSEEAEGKTEEKG